MKRVIKVLVLILIILIALICASLALSNYRRNQVQLSVVNPVTYVQADIPSLFDEMNTDTLHLMIYDSENDDCIYLDEVMLKEISFDYDGTELDSIYKIVYEDSSRTYTNQTIKNTYQIQAIPAIVTIEQTESGFTKTDSFEWSGNTEEDKQALTDYLLRNGLIQA